MPIAPNPPAYAALPSREDFEHMYPDEGTSERRYTGSATEDLRLEFRRLQQCVDIIEAKARSNGTFMYPSSHQPLITFDDFPDLERFLDLYVSHCNDGTGLEDPSFNLLEAVEDHPDLTWQHAFWLRMYLYRRGPKPGKGKEFTFPMFVRRSYPPINFPDAAMEEVTSSLVRNELFIDVCGFYGLGETNRRGIHKTMRVVKKKNWQVGPYLGPAKDTVGRTATVQYMQKLERIFGIPQFI